MSRFGGLAGGSIGRSGAYGGKKQKDDSGLDAWNAIQSAQKLAEEARRVGESLKSGGEGEEDDDDEEAWEKKEDESHCRPFERDDDWLPSVKGHFDLDTTGVKLIGTAFPFALRTVLPKLLYQGFGQYITPFRKPFFLCTITFAVMCLGILDGVGSKKTSSIHALKMFPGRAIARLVPMAVFELIGCAAMLVAMIRLPASQAELLNVAGHSLFFEVIGSLVRGKSLSLLQWGGSALVAGGTVLATVSNVMHLGGGPMKPWFVTVLLAVLIAPLAFFARSLCETSLGKEEGVKTSAGLFVGTQGIIGLVLQLAVVFPLISVLPGADVGNKLENIPDSLHVLGHSWPLMLLLVLYGTSVVMTGFSSRGKVMDADAPSREVWKLLRVAIVWILELTVFRVTHGAVGEFWYPLCWLRLCSFGLLVGGMRAFHAGTGPDIAIEDPENAQLIGDQGHSFKKGHHVRVRPDIDEPKWGWRKVERHSVGVICGVQSDGTVRVHFPEANSWQGDPRDLVIDPVADLIRPGTYVKLKPDVDQPSFGWGKYKPGMVGEVITVRYDGLVLLKFDWGPWKGLLNELETAPAPKKQTKRFFFC